MKVRICGDGKRLDGPCLLIMNHRTRFDWMFLWCYLVRMGDLKKLKIVLKDSLKAVPVLGEITLTSAGREGLAYYVLSKGRNSHVIKLTNQLLVT